MLAFRLTISAPLRKELQQSLKTAQRLGRLRLAIRILAILALAAGQSEQQVATAFQVSVATVQHWKLQFLCYQLKGLQDRKSPGRKAKLTKTQKQQLAALLDAGPQACGFSSACWR